MFDDIPEDSYQSYSCTDCNEGEITLNKEGQWECSKCDFKPYIKTDDLEGADLDV